MFGAQINKLYYNAHTEPLFIRNKILQLDDLYTFEVSQFMFDCINCFLPKEGKEAHRPDKIVKLKKHKHKKNGWITSGILRSIKHRDGMYKKTEK